MLCLNFEISIFVYSNQGSSPCTSRDIDTFGPTAGINYCIAYITNSFADFVGSISCTCNGGYAQSGDGLIFAYTQIVVANQYSSVYVLREISLALHVYDAALRVNGHPPRKEFADSNRRSAKEGVLQTTDINANIVWIYFPKRFDVLSLSRNWTISKYSSSVGSNDASLALSTINVWGLCTRIKINK